MLRLTSGQWTQQVVTGLKTLTSRSHCPLEQSRDEHEKEPRVLYKSDHFVVVDKCYDLKINSDDEEERFTVAHQLGLLYPDIVDRRLAHGFRFIHRLDYATSGCLCVALNKAAARWGNKAFAKRYVTKHYIALVHGHLDSDSQRVVNINVAVGNDASVRDVYKMCANVTPINNTTASVSNSTSTLCDTNVILPCVLEDKHISTQSSANNRNNCTIHNPQLKNTSSSDTLASDLPDLSCDKLNPLTSDVIGPVCVNPREASTHLVLLQLGQYDGLPVSKVLLIPFTGRTHQLRVHCRHIGHTVVGDYTYSDRTDVTPYRMMLHALRLVIPMKRETIDVTSPDPFTPLLDPLWTPTHTIQEYEQFVNMTCL